MSLPDTTIESEGDIRYTFRAKIENSSFSFGSVFFRQKKDLNAPRGYSQKSLVALTRSHEMLHVANEFVRVISPLYFSFGIDVLEAACNECKSWPPPDNRILTLSVAGTQIYSQPFPSTELFQDVPLFTTFGSLCVGLWLLWELALTGQPILILGPTPDRCSKAVLGICSLISPIPLGVDYRPFFTIFDPDFPLVSRTDNPPCMIIGGTNPFLLRSLEHFPNVVSLGVPSNPDITQVARRNQPLRSLLRNKRWEKSLVLTGEDPLIARDEKLLSQLRNLGSDPKATILQNNEKLRAAFRDITKRFLAPLETFVRMRPIGEKAAKGGIRVSAYKDEILLEDLRFSAESFLASLSSRASIRDKQFPIALYKKFLSGPNFPLWLEYEVKKISKERFLIRRTLIVHTDTEYILSLNMSSQSGGHENIYARISDALSLERSKPNCDEELCERMQQHLEALDKAKQ